MTTTKYRMVAEREAPPVPAAEQPTQFHPGPMRLADLVYGVWAIEPAALRQMQEIYETHLRSDKIDLAGIEARLGRPLQKEPQGYEVTNGVAVLPVHGPIAPKANLMTRVSGGTSAQLAMRDLRAAAADPAVRGIVLSVDSPGGSVLGTPELAELVRTLSESKPIATHSDGTMASAAYWIGSAAPHAFISGPTVQVGSIGVVATHTDVSGAEERAGIKTTEITAGKYKRIASEHAPLTKQGRAALQEKVDYHYSLFVDAVAAHRGVSVDRVLGDMADGRVFVGRQAMEAGLVDGIRSLDDLIEAMAADPAKFARRAPAPVSSRPSRAGAAQGADPVSPTEKGVLLMDQQEQGAAASAAPVTVTAESLRASHPQVHAEILAAGARQERDRIAAVRKQALPGHEALIERLAMDGTTTGAEAAVAVLAAEREAIAGKAKAHADDAPTAVDSSPAPADTPKASSKQQDADRVAAYVEKNGGTFAAAAKALGINYAAD